MKRRVAAWLALAACSAIGGGDIVSDVRAACAAHNFALAGQEIQRYRASAGVTPDMMEALSWLARAALDDRQYDRADNYALETRRLALEYLNRAGKGDTAIVTALGAAIEVHAQALAGEGRRADSVAYLNGEMATWSGSPMAPRIQKNINLLTMESKPAPALEIGRWLGAKPASLAELKGHPVLLFFWAHWCGDCKAEAPILAHLMATYGPKGLVLVGPTQLYGYTAAGDASPEVEMRYVEEVRREFYSALGSMTIPVSAENFQRYGASTTPTLVLLDSGGTVRLYHPGAMTYDGLAGAVKRVLAARESRS
ncbi:MAG TPA: TlpA disulfide reductase family protein [Bryobacteraceae bacterium]|jgi:thiol-disulfide isomerase/thioredoxin|nr:TlpA disulfide reductase family protein [Bryobacteraceae bacterium]